MIQPLVYHTKYYIYFRLFYWGPFVLLLSDLPYIRDVLYFVFYLFFTPLYLFYNISSVFLPVFMKGGLVSWVDDEPVSFALGLPDASSPGVGHG